MVAGPGDVAIVTPGTPHRFWNAGQCDARWCEVRPALDYESLSETMINLAAKARPIARECPTFRLAVIARAHFDTVRLAFPPAWLQRAALTIGAPLGRLAGYQPTAIGMPVRRRLPPLAGGRTFVQRTTGTARQRRRRRVV